jgi:Na+/proline symporter
MGSDPQVSGWIALAVYVIGFAVTARVAAVHMDDDEDARLHATIVALIWPIALAIFCVIGILSLPTLGVTTLRDRQRKAETAEWERGKREARLAELEREAGIERD